MEMVRGDPTAQTSASRFLLRTVGTELCSLNRRFGLHNYGPSVSYAGEVSSLRSCVKGDGVRGGWGVREGKGGEVPGGKGERGGFGERARVKSNSDSRWRWCVVTQLRNLGI